MQPKQSPNPALSEVTSENQRPCAEFLAPVQLGSTPTPGTKVERVAPNALAWERAHPLKAR